MLEKLACNVPGVANHRYEAEVEFMTAKEWRNQVKSLWHDLLDEEGKSADGRTLASWQAVFHRHLLHGSIAASTHMSATISH